MSEFFILTDSDYKKLHLAFDEKTCCDLKKLDGLYGKAFQSNNLQGEVVALANLVKLFVYSNILNRTSKFVFLSIYKMLFHEARKLILRAIKEEPFEDHLFHQKLEALKLNYQLLKNEIELLLLDEKIKRLSNFDFSEPDQASEFHFFQ
ncbi:MAG: hypothetical protein ACE365_04030 [Gammaproteobacteria bacterium]